MMGSINRLKGTVKWFDSRRGFGFISPEETEGDLFVHKSSIEGVGVRSLTAGETVEFVVSVGDDGRSSAVSVTGPGGVCIPGRRYFGGVCYRCNEVGHMARDCRSNASICNLGPCYSCGLMGHLSRKCPTTRFPNFLNGSFSSISPLAATRLNLLMDKNPFKISFGLLSGATDSEEEEQTDESDEDESQRGGELRNWAELPDDILMVIFQKITAAEILRSAQFVCKSWRRLSFVPALWRCIDMRVYDLFDDMESVAIMAVDRSKGCLEELYVEYFPTDKLMPYIAERATKLRSLHLISVCQYVEMLIETVRKFPMLEELEIVNVAFSSIEQVAQACPQLKSFSYNERLYKLAYADPDSLSDRNVDMDALSIAKHLKQLRRLQLFGNDLSSTGLLAILDNCPHLEHLDIRQCLNVDLDEKLKKKCARIKVLKLPNDSTADYPFRHSSIDDLNGYNTYFEPTLYDTDSDFEYDDFRYDYYGGPPSDMSFDFYDDDLL